jgi:hypothetical protein
MNGLYRATSLLFLGACICPVIAGAQSSSAMSRTVPATRAAALPTTTTATTATATTLPSIGRTVQIPGLTPTPSMARPAQTDIAAPSRTSAMDAAVPSPMGVNSSGNVASNTVTTTAHSTPDTAAATIPGHTTATAATASGGGGGGTAAGTYDASSSPTNNDNRGRWGWVGIFGLLGLFGLRRDRSYRTVTIDETRAEPTVHTHV